MAREVQRVDETSEVLTARGLNDEEDLSKDELVADFVTEGGENFVHSSEVLS